MKDVQFTDNSANIGGAIRWNLVEMIVKDSNDKFEKLTDAKEYKYGSLTFRGNNATEYGPEIASVARELIIFNQTETYLNYYHGTVEQRQELVPESDRSKFFNNYTFEGV